MNNLLKSIMLKRNIKMKSEKRMSELNVGEFGLVTSLLTEGSMRRRFLDIGLSAGTRVSCIGKSPLGDPSLYLVRGCKIAIRKRDAEGIIIASTD